MFLLEIRKKWIWKLPYRLIDLRLRWLWGKQQHQCCRLVISGVSPKGAECGHEWNNFVQCDNLPDPRYTCLYSPPGWLRLILTWDRSDSPWSSYQEALIFGFCFPFFPFNPSVCWSIDKKPKGVAIILRSTKWKNVDHKRKRDMIMCVFTHTRWCAHSSASWRREEQMFRQSVFKLKDYVFMETFFFFFGENTNALELFY